MIIESGHDLHLLVHAFFREQEEPDVPAWARRPSYGYERHGPLVVAVLDDALRCSHLEQVSSNFFNDFHRATSRILDAVVHKRGRYVVLAHRGDGRRAELEPDGMAWSASLQRLRLELADAGAIVLRHIIYDDGVSVDGWHQLSRESVDDDFAASLERARVDARERLLALEEQERVRRLPYVPPPPTSYEGTLLTTELGEEDFRELTWKVDALTRFLQKNGLKGHGRKADLIDRVADLLAGRDVSEWRAGRANGRPVFTDAEPTG
ncbi:SAP domain-containing protein [Microbacteriaceae bacterium VKM Ac-2855]|nr:SAP domain-containing protein [Microbacteriaceae bacterium VKM Ac-2855]